jgi:CheY-like chemotaxis protein/signal transduction histidine kinase
MSAYVVIAAVVGCVLGALLVLAVTIPRLRRGRAALPAPAPSPPAAAPRGDGHDQVVALTEERAQLDERTKRAERADALRNLLVSKMSHDLRTPLNSVVTLSQLLLEGNAGALTIEQRKYVEIIHRNGQTLLALISDILDLASLEAGRLEVEAVPFDLRALARGVADAAAPAARKKGLPLHVNLPRRAVFARADEERLRHVLLALVERAVAGTRNGYVELSVDGDGERARVLVADTGGGLPAEARGALYDDFLTQVGPFAASSVPSLSLALAGRVVRLMNGDITVDSVAGEGATFTIALPAAPDEAAARTRDGQAESEEAAAAPGGGAGTDGGAAAEKASGHVLLIEDDEIERRRVRDTLVAAGYDVTLSSSGDEGLGLLAASHYDAVVLDLVMPGMSGLDVLRRARADERLAGTPFVVLSALYMTKNERDVLGPGVSGVVRKGDDTSAELVAQLRRAVARGAAVAGARGGDRRAGPAPSSNAPRARVLVVEDNVDNLFTIQKVLASLPVTIETAASGPEAIELCRHHPPDLIMMDVELPGMSGLDASRAIHALPDCANVPIIALTADVMQGDRERVLAAQCSAYLPKPVQPLDVVSAVTRALHLAAH